VYDAEFTELLFSVQPPFFCHEYFYLWIYVYGIGLHARFNTLKRTPYLHRIMHNKNGKVFHNTVHEIVITLLFKFIKLI